MVSDQTQPSIPKNIRADHYTRQLRKLAEVGAALCCYLPGADDPELWPTARCDCKYLPNLFSVLRREYAGLDAVTSEMTGCCEVRQAWRALNALLHYERPPLLEPPGRASEQTVDEGP